jgi:DNA-directed RNA polymerase subunit RPC12/RpoP
VNVQPAAEAVTLNCSRCGGAVPLSAIAAQAVCPYCGHRIALGPHEIVELERYRSKMREQLARADTEHTQAARWERWYGGKDAEKRNHPLIGVLVAAGLIVPLIGVGVAAQALGLSTQTLNTIMPIAWGVVMVTVLGGYFAWFYAGRSPATKQRAPLAAPVRCPTCGAPHSLAAGAVLDRCRHCGSALLPDETARELALDQAERAALDAELARHRAERRGMAAVSSMSAGNAVPYIVLGSFLPFTVFGAIGATATALFGDPKEAPLAAVLGLWAFAITNVALLAGVFVFRTQRRRRWQRIIAFGVAPFRGTSLRDIHAVVAWLDQHWPGGVPYNELFAGPCFSGAQLWAQGLPVCVIVNPVGMTDDYPGFITVRVGAWQSVPDQRHPNAIAMQSWLSRFGARLAVERAGVVVHFDETATGRIGRGSGAELAEAIGAAAQLAAQLRHSPSNAGK